MTAQNRAGKRRLGIDEDPSDSVPEADAAEQSAQTTEEEDDQWLDRPAGRGLDQANEADLVEQLRELGADDEDEHR
ncbi:hypothetical protein [Nocardiopsis sp. FIRDI 009]|uniref:hypothetical protein n=1 Tax=Nocardiopsis sp. FIRDI 009 TaxID=714197 RepID=UPI000E2856B8|nr:hypothetical protein [Nocardiopsis sp. FIRDI 009]